MTTYFHGGIPGLWPGQRILPPEATGTRVTHDMAATGRLAEEVARTYRPDRVYLTTDRLQADIYAAVYPTGGRLGGAVYRVCPDGDVELDPDWLGEDGVSVHAPAATILGVVALAVDPGPYLDALTRH